MRTKLIFIFSVFCLLFGITSCFKSKEYPVEPIISEPNFVFWGTDSVRLSFSFTDGDGDIGIHDNDTFPPYNPGSEFYYNLYLDYYEKDDANGWQRGLDLAGDSISFKYRLEPIIVKGKERGIKGTMDITMKDSSYYNFISPQSDTIKYGIRLIDKALNVSNVLMTDEIIR